MRERWTFLIERLIISPMAQRHETAYYVQEVKNSSLMQEHSEGLRASKAELCEITLEGQVS